jgi:ribosome-associated protein
MPEGVLEITPDLHLPFSELEYRASRSGGPGGQHVNTSSTRIELWWDVTQSPTLTAARLDARGRLRLVSSGSRSQLRNRENVTERLRSLVAAALVPPKKRKRTAPTRAAKAARLEAKRRRAATKQQRRNPLPDD